MRGISKSQGIMLITEEVKTCRRCSLWKTRKNPVIGEGNPDSFIILIGEAPGYWEDVEGKPFVGAAGKVLEEALREAGLSRREIYITNLLKCRPPRNREPRRIEINSCAPYLKRQLELMKPRFIVTLGRYSTDYILSNAGFKFTGMKEVRGRLIETELWDLKVHVLPTFHPAAVLYNVRLKEDLKRDLKLLKIEVEKVMPL